ncbi:oxalate:formate antiporter-like isoform X4 [Eriocheir sinensis]|nr:oxalate:formate antiporter-like isoform X4 [Eriocheir sinensis]XP_050740379.1 oxalate:formate antiporter-like isoform X4 [Eriocheir sinensis]XP_050740380.1 oxalate:formate antiporter-like isoform X4 [Eriocheir sinensis]XP_050740382.1 oxalate:formate antiporter-like isoform X4 [Eriocheir sinensis]XP_050740383.1 oxalate:formate antiporter-like isoform X4 [Eriocheir sinensis]XP_050740384.1 oxalate:formate antiporter-like isoform X4 [Eriocheir sinensis]XP_050740385.1 oxalate:formate antiporter
MMRMARENIGGVCATIGGILIHLTLGNLYSFGNMMTYMVSFMHERVDPSITYANFLWVNSITTTSQGFFMVLGGLLEKRIGPRLTCLIGCSLLSTGIMLTSLTVEVSLFAVILTYGLLAGLGISLSYTTPLSCGMQWFPRHKGLINGLIVAGFGLGALGSTTLQTMYLNPDNISPQDNGYFTDPGILDYVPSVFILLGVIFLVMQVIGCLLLNKPPDNRTTHHGQEVEGLLSEEAVGDTQELSTSMSTSSGHASSTPAATVTMKNLKPLEVIKEKTFYVLWLIYFFNTIPIGYINAMGKSFGQTFIKDDHFLAVMVSLAAIFNASGRVVWGRLMDLTSFRVAMRLLTSVLAFLFATMPLTAYMGKTAFTLWLWAIFFTFSGTFVLMPTATEKAFGAEHYSANYGLLFTTQAVSGPLIAVGNQVLLTAFGFTGCFLVVAVVICLSVGMTFLIPRRI